MVIKKLNIERGIGMGNAILFYSIGIVTAFFFINFIVILKGIKDDKYIWFNTGLGALMLGYIVSSCILVIKL